MVLDPETEPELLRVISNILQKYEMKDKCQRKEPEANVPKSHSQESGIDAQKLGMTRLHILYKCIIRIW